jgi:C4-dicarboxylate-specific signal transduction histidine kinase
MSAVAMAGRPQQTRGTHGEARGYLAPAGTLDGTDVQHLDLGALARHAVALLHATGHMAPAEVRLELPDEPVFARVSRWRLEQVLFHLVTHAVEAQRGEGPTASAVRLMVEPQDDFGDNGPTFRVRYLARGPSKRTSLEVAGELVAALGGNLTKGHHGRTGTTLTVELPKPEQDPGTASW